MRAIIIGFDNQMALSKIQKELQKLGEKDVAFIKKNSKVAVIDALEKGAIYACLLTERIGYDVWTAEELAALRDNSNAYIVPILSKEDYYGTDKLKLLYNAGISSAILQKGRGLKASEIAKLLMYPRNLKEARQYYGITSMTDVIKDTSGQVMTEEQVSQYKAALYDTTFGTPGSNLGGRYYALAMKLTPLQNIYFLEQLGSELHTRLAEFPEYYDVLDALKAAGISIRFKRPKKFKKSVLSRRSSQIINGEVLDINGEVMDTIQPILDEDYYHFVESNDQSDIDEENDESFENENFGFVDYAQEQEDDILEETYGFMEKNINSNEAVSFMKNYNDMSDLNVDVEKKENIPSEEQEQEEITNMDDSIKSSPDLELEEEVVNEYGFLDGEGNKITETDFENDMLADDESLSVVTHEDAEEIDKLISEEEEKETEQELLNKKHHIFAFALISIAILVVVLISVFIIITIQRKETLQAAQESLDSGYDVIYKDTEHDEEANFYQLEVSETGGLIDNSKEQLSVSDNSENNSGELEEISLIMAPKHTVSVSENSMEETSTAGTTYVTATSVETASDNTTQINNSKQPAVVNGVSTVIQSINQKTENTTEKNDEKEVTTTYPSYNYRPTQLASDYGEVIFKEGEEISGLDLLNALNAKNGKDCIVEFSDGERVEIKAGAASLGDISIRAKYKIAKEGSSLKFIEQ